MSFNISQTKYSTSPPPPLFLGVLKYTDFYQNQEPITVKMELVSCSYRKKCTPSLYFKVKPKHILSWAFSCPLVQLLKGSKLTCVLRWYFCQNLVLTAISFAWQRILLQAKPSLSIHIFLLHCRDLQWNLDITDPCTDEDACTTNVIINYSTRVRWISHDK